MKELNRRSILRRAPALAGAAAALLPQGIAGAQDKGSQPYRKWRVVAVGGRATFVLAQVAAFRFEEVRAKPNRDIDSARVERFNAPFRHYPCAPALSGLL
jgi:hypothetical protein